MRPQEFEISAFQSSSLYVLQVSHMCFAHHRFQQALQSRGSLNYRNKEISFPQQISVEFPFRFLGRNRIWGACVPRRGWDLFDELIGFDDVKRMELWIHLTRLPMQLFTEKLRLLKLVSLKMYWMTFFRPYSWIGRAAHRMQQSGDESRFWHRGLYMKIGRGNPQADIE